MRERRKQVRLSADARRSQILQSASRVFAQRGYFRASTRDLAEAAGISEPLLYLHFPNKCQLFMAAVEESRSRRLIELRNILREADVRSSIDLLYLLCAAFPRIYLNGDSLFEPLCCDLSAQESTWFQREEDAVIAVINEKLQPVSDRIRLDPRKISNLLLHVVAQRLFRRESVEAVQGRLRLWVDAHAAVGS
jgi:AcrR family transcriptional regulator